MFSQLSFCQNIFPNEPNYFMHMFNVSTVYRQSIELPSANAVVGVDRPMKHYACIYKIHIRDKLAKCS